MPISSGLIYDSERHGNYALDEIRQCLRYRNLLAQLIRRDITSRYKRSVLGVAWTMLNPLGMMLVLTVVFSHVFGSIRGYPAYILSGLMVWSFFSQTTTAAMVNLVWGGGLLNRIYIPRTSFAIAAIGTGTINLLITMIPLIVVMLITGVPLSPTILFFPVPLLLVSCFALGVGLLLSTIAIYFPDVAEMYQIGMTAWMYLTPIIYPETALPQQYAYLITHLNPMYYMIRLFRVLFYEGRMPKAVEFWPAVLIAAVALAAGWFIFTKKSDEFAYRV
jgi:ABC-type polysaccharide/polyol phosphate export permease